MDADLREPRFLSFKGKLSLYFFMGSIHTFKFIPKNIYCIQKKNGKWQQPAIAYKEGFVPWRIRIFNGKAYMSIYYGKEIYHKRHNFAVHLLESSNGKDWQQITKDPQITRKGATETEFEFDDDGNIYGTVRLEGYGSLVFHAPKDDLGNWKTRYNYFKHDSALLLKHENELYLISRKNSLGPADISPPFMPDWFRAWHNMIQYSLTPKRTAIYHFNKEQLRIRGLKTLPSRGDTGFPSVMKLDKNRYFLLNYSSNLRLPINIPWIFGQFANTNLYSQELRFGRT